MIKLGYRADFIKRMCVSAVKVHEALKDVHTAVKRSQEQLTTSVTKMNVRGLHYFWFPISHQAPTYWNPCAVTMLG